MRIFMAILTFSVVLTIATMTSGCADDPVESNDTTASAGAAGTTGTTVGGVDEDVVAAALADPDPSPPVEQEQPYGAGTTGRQSAGELLDGLQLNDIRWGDHGTYFRIVFDLGTSSGEPVLQAPHADAAMSSAATGIEVTLGGIRSVSGNPNTLSEQIVVGDSMVTLIERVPSMDDQALVYRINLSSPSTYSLSSLSSPGRIIIDVYK